MDYLEALRMVSTTAATATTTATALITLVTLLVLYFTFVKHLHEFRQRNKLRCRADADYALKMAEQTSDERFKQMGVQLGMAGLFGGPDVSDAQRRVLVALGDPFYWDRRYQSCAHFVQIENHSGAPFWWRSAYESSANRSRSKRLHVALVVWLVFLAFLMIVQLSMGAPTVNVFVAWSLVTLLLVTSFLVMLHLTKLSESAALIADASEWAGKGAAPASTARAT